MTMRRRPLKEAQQADSMSNEQSTLTPGKTKDYAKAVAAKLLDSAKKSQTNKVVKRTKLSLPKNDTSKKPSGRAQALSGSPDLNETTEFQDSVSMKAISRQPLFTKKRKKSPSSAEDCTATKSVRLDSEEVGASFVKDLTNRSNNPDYVIKVSSRKTVQTSKHAAKDMETGNTSDSAALHSLGSPRSGKSEEKLESPPDKRLSTSMHTCPTCEQMFPRGRLVRHMQQCLQQNEAEAEPSTATRSPHATGGMVQDPQGVEALPADYVFCQLCQKDLSHLNVHRRTLHINSCIDAEEKKRAEAEEEKQALEKARSQVLECPLCGKPLSTAASRLRHLKQCAAGLGVDSEQLLARVKQQEEEHALKLAAGVLPVPAASRSGRNTRQNSTSTRRGLAAVPRSKVDEDTQLALAISSSLQPNPADPGPSGPTSRPLPARRGRKHQREEDHLLLKLTRTQAATRVEGRVSDLIMQQEDEEQENMPPLPEISGSALHGGGQWMVRSSVQEGADQSKTFWRLSSLDSDAGDDTGDGEGTSLQFYVGALMPPVEVSAVAAGSKTRRMSEIPGRCSSQRTTQTVAAGDSRGEMQESDGTLSGDVPRFTQAVALLADMAAEADGNDASHEGSLSQPSVSHFDDKVHHDLLSAYASLVNREEFSDLVITAGGDSSLYAHRLILSVRCPMMLKMTDEKSGVVDLSAFPPSSVLDVLRYLYAGSTTLDIACVSQTLQLAQRFDLTPLAEVCRNQLPTLPLMDENVRQTGEEMECDSANSSVHIFTESESEEEEGASKMEVSSSDRAHQGEITSTGHLSNASQRELASLASSRSERKDVSCAESKDRKASFSSSSQGRSESSLQCQEVGKKVRSQESKKTGEVSSWQKHSKKISSLDQSEGFCDREEGEGNSSFADMEADFLLADFEERLSEQIESAFKSLDEEGKSVQEGQRSSGKGQRSSDLPILAKGSNEGQPNKARKQFGELSSRSSFAHNADINSDTDDVRIVEFPRETDVSPSVSRKHSKSGVEKKTNSSQDKRPSHRDPDSSTANDDVSTINSPDQNDSVRRVKAKSRELGTEKEKQADSIPEPVDSVEISDDDLFSDRESETFCLPSMSRFPNEQAVSAKGRAGDSLQAHQGKENVERFAARDIDRCPAFDQTTSDLVLPQGNKTNVDSGESCSGKSVCSETESPSVSFRKDSSKSVRPTAEDKSQYLGRSAVGLSSSPGVHGFQTSTPQSILEADKTHRSVTGFGDETAVFKSRTSVGSLCRPRASQRAEVQHGSLSVDSVADRELGSEVCDLGVEKTPRVSVVDQDSLYVTPVASDNNIRRTFQLVTPLVQLSTTTAASKASHGKVQKGAGDASVGHSSREMQRAGEEISSSQGRAQSATDTHSPPERLGEDGGEKRGDDNSDDDVEIISSSLQDAPSPKFSLSSRVSSSQSERGERKSGPSPTRSGQSGQREGNSGDDLCKPRPGGLQDCGLSAASSQPRTTSASQQGSRASQSFRESSTDLQTLCPAERESIRPGEGGTNSEAGSPPGRLSQRSADSDSELLRMVELASKEAIAIVDKSDMSAVARVSERQSDTEMADCASPLEAGEDVWEGFDDLDLYNPDLPAAFDGDPSCSPVVVSDKPGTPTSPNLSPHSKASTLIGSLSGHTLPGSKEHRTASGISQSPACLSQQQTPKQSAESRPSSKRCSSPDRVKSVKGQSKHQSTPVKFRSGAVNTAGATASRSNNVMEDVGGEVLGGGREDLDRGGEGGNEEQSDVEGGQSAGGFLLAEDDQLAASSSFLWSEENAPSEEGVTIKDDSLTSDVREAGQSQSAGLALGAEKLASVTPVTRKQKKKKGGKSAWAPPSPFTPMPPYDAMNTPALKTEVQKFGLKVVGKKRMKLILKDIYSKTHQYETDSDCDIDEANAPSLSSKTDGKSATSAAQPSVAGKALGKASGRQTGRGRGKQGPVVAAKGTKGRRHSASQQTSAGETQSRGEGTKALRGGRKAQSSTKSMAAPLVTNFHSPTKQAGVSRQGGVGTLSPAKSGSDYSSSPEKGTASSSRDSDASDRPDVSVFEEGLYAADSDEDLITPSQQIPQQDLQQKLMEFFRTFPGLYIKVLTYEPLDLGIVKENLKSSGIRCSQEKLLDFLDEKCITFTTKNMVPRHRRNRGARKPRAKKVAESRN